jgi:FeS assembly protein IscX
MGLHWTDVRDLATTLERTYPGTDVADLKFSDLWELVRDLPEFDDDTKVSDEQVLEAIRVAWLEERE